jgi:hypothetical protein
MTLAVMQPYLFPYIGYFQLIHAVDTFVVFDDVQYIQRGWINRNRILRDGGDAMITLPVRKDARELAINQRYYTEPIEPAREQMLRQIETSYRKAPHFTSIMPVLEEALACEDANVAAFTTHSLSVICRHLGIKTPLRSSAELQLGPELRGEGRVLRINQILGADRYINPIGGTELYNASTFAEAGVELRFIRTLPIEYPQFGAPFVPWLSIIDVMMFNPTETIREFLDRYELIEAPERVEA